MNKAITLMVQHLERQYRDSLSSSDTAESVAKRWKDKLESWRISHSLDPVHDPALGHVDLNVKFSGPIAIVRAAFPQWERLPVENGIVFQIGDAQAFWDGVQLTSRFSALGVSTAQFEHKIQNFIKMVEHAESEANKELDRHSDRLHLFERELEVKRENDQKAEVARELAAQVADVGAVLEKLKIKKSS